MLKTIISKWLFLDFKTFVNEKFIEFVFLSIRVATALIMLFAHGIGKWMNFSPDFDTFKKNIE